MKLIQLMTAGTLLAVLAACGGPAGPATPDATSVAPSVAERGASIVIAGSGFGTAPGTVRVGGVTAAVTDWTASSITATVPAGASNAWQDVSVTTAGGSDTLEDLFVGVPFTGTGPQLQAFLDGQANGTAVLLQAASYDLSAQATPFIIDNKDLYGRGQAQTTLALPTAAETIVLAEFGASTTLADLTMEGDNFNYLHGTLADTFIPVSVTRAAALPADLDELRARMAQVLQGAPLLPAAATNPQIVLDRLTFNETGAGTWGLIALMLPKVDLLVRDSTIDVPTSQVSLVAGGNITLEGSSVTAEMLQVLSLTGQVNLMTAETTVHTMTTLAAESGLTIADSTVRLTDGNLVLIGAAAGFIGGSSLPSGGAIEIKGSTVEVLDANLLDATDNGMVEILTQFAPISLLDNVLLRSHDDFTVVTLDSQAGEADIELSGNLDVRVGVFASESAGGARAATLQLLPQASSLRNRLTLDGNTIAVTGSVAAHNGGTPGNLFVANNTITAGDGATPGSVTLAALGEGTVEIIDNEVTVNDDVEIIGGDLDSGTMVVSGNRFTNVAATLGTVVIQGVGGSCQVADNQVDLDDPSDVNGSSLVGICTGAGPGHSFVVTGNDLKATGDVASAIVLIGSSIGTFGVTDNQLHTGQVLQVQAAGAALNFSDNTVEQHTGALLVVGDAASQVSVSGNTVVQHDPQEHGLALLAMGTATVTDNTFTGQGTPSAMATALHVGTSSNAVTVTATGNTFTNYTRALSFQDVAVAAHGITASINDNVFDFTIDAAPKVATLTNVKDAINATDNQWGSNTVLATVQGYVTLAGDTVGQGGSILLNPIKLP